ncbi:MAG: hypothetical protein P3A28_00730 [Gemmatimonadota bacterium]|nr:hypothetical protein [Gemmatimonadota bacterium]
MVGTRWQESRLAAIARNGLAGLVDRSAIGGSQTPKIKPEVERGAPDRCVVRESQEIE